MLDSIEAWIGSDVEVRSMDRYTYCKTGELKSADPNGIKLQIESEFYYIPMTSVAQIKLIREDSE